MAINGIGAVSTPSIQNMDLETAMMAVQSHRANQLEAQLKDQIASVQAKNEQIAKLNTVLGKLNELVAKFPPDAKADAKAKFTDEERAALKSAVDHAGMTEQDLFGGNFLSINAESKSKFDMAITSLKGSIDSLSNTQQMDMLRLQSLSNKRNEAFDVMTNFLKKMQDNRSAIIGNMR